MTTIHELRQRAAAHDAAICARFEALMHPAPAKRSRRRSRPSIAVTSAAPPIVEAVSILGYLHREHATRAPREKKIPA